MNISMKEKKVSHACKHPEISTLLKEAGLSATKPRRLLLEILLHEHGPFSVEQLLEKLPNGACDQATIYRCMTSFTKSGLTRSINLGEDFLRYEIAIHGEHDHHHHHIICRECKNIQSIDLCALEVFEKAFKKLGYNSIEHNMEFSGLCRSCRKEELA
jgi:Fe2+ or Zn2+ uptake regulation protein